MKSFIFTSLVFSVWGCTTQRGSIICIPEEVKTVTVRSMDFDIDEQTDFYICQPVNIHGSY